jgi:fatty acid desaturase
MNAVSQTVEIDDRSRTVVAGGHERDQIVDCLGIDASSLRNLLKDLYPPRMAIYWVDFLLSIVVGYGALLAFPIRQPLSMFAIAAFVCSVLACYRAAIFVHELAHARGSRFAAFRLVWNILCGVPLFIPSFLYEAHRTHHIARTFGSLKDGEYVALARLPWSSTAGLLSASLLVPAKLMFRFVALGPLSWLLPAMREAVLSRASALMVIDVDYRRPLPTGRTPRRWLVQEAACSLWGVALLAALVWGIIPLVRFVEVYAVLATVSLLNALRVIVAHRYLNESEPMTFAEQVLDSNSFVSPLAELWAPVGLRCHGVHHLVPELPYHALSEAQRRITSAIPPDSPFRSTLRRSLFSAVFELFQSCRKAPRSISIGAPSRPCSPPSV